ncbi:MAG TPA: SDR family oxidoreductase [Alphaproteobacteria bacterium]|nr:SDR family oxidoreductase [Alphaproteobacteria bacterium]
MSASRQSAPTQDFDLVTGGAGFIGSHLVDALVARGRKVRVLDNLSVGRASNLEQHKASPAVELWVGDVADAPTVLRAMQGAARVFHLAALADIVPSIENPHGYFRSNVDGTFAVLEAARAHKVQRLVYVASSSCYGIPDSFPTPETAPPRPQYPYALTKWLGEQQVLHWTQVYKLPAICLRFFNVYGPRARTSGTYGAVFGVFLAQLLAGKPLTIVGDGNQTRDFTFVSDAVDALITAAESSVVGETLNVGSGRTVSINHLVSLLKPRSVTHIPKRPGEPDCTFADIARIRSVLGWEPKVPFEKGVEIMLANLDYWRDAPVWTADKIAETTKAWFAYLSPSAQAAE